MICVACLGGAVLDRVYLVDSLPAGGGKTFALGVRESGGGIAATAACAVAALGGQARWFGPLGGDEVGRDVLRRLRDRGVGTDGAQVLTGVATPVSTGLVDTEGERRLLIYRDPALQLSPVLLPSCDAVMVDHRHVAASLAALREGAERGIPTVLDADAGAPEQLPKLVEAAKHAVFARAALAAFTGTDDPEAGLRAAVPRAASDAVLGVTLGERGSLFLVAGSVVRVGTPRVVARDTTGCGDVFHGAYALALAEGHGVPEAARFAAAAAALKAQAGEGWDGMPGRADIEALMREEW